MDLGNPIAKGNTADIYLCDKKIIKVLKDYLPETEAIKEADKQRLAWKAGLPVPEILDVIKIENRQAVVMEYITGDTLGNMMLKDGVFFGLRQIYCNIYVTVIRLCYPFNIVFNTVFSYVIRFSAQMIII